MKKAALAEVDKLDRTSEQSPEGGWIRTWLDTVLELPWNERTEDIYDIAAARAVLDADHAGLDDVKERIIEYLAVRKRRAESGLGPVGGRRSGAVLALAGPPGVGKTSLGESVAKAMGRKFVRVALGGIRDEAEIRGHRRTYVGALPGRIVRAIKEAGSMNPVVLLDEIDKVGADYRGDPTAALLEVLDPEQNHTFRDHYLEVELDLSDVVFLATANALETIPGPLLDRMELVTLDGYTEHEKVTIARDHLLPRELERAGLGASDVVLTDSAFSRIAAEYTREAGVRDANRTIAKVLRKIATKVALDEVSLPLSVDAAALETYLGRPRHLPESSLPASTQRTATPGVATGLAVTGAGGDVLYIEASLADKESGASGLQLTGQLGDVMKESVQIALSYLRSHGAELELPVGDLRERGIHVHVPAGAVPKDGPSAGITMTTALASLLSGRVVRADVAMTGEVSLTGRVLPIGGVKQKLLAAHRAGHEDGDHPAAQRAGPRRRPGRGAVPAGGPRGGERPRGPGARSDPGFNAGFPGGVTPSAATEGPHSPANGGLRRARAANVQTCLTGLGTKAFSLATWWHARLGFAQAQRSQSRRALRTPATAAHSPAGDAGREVPQRKRRCAKDGRPRHDPSRLRRKANARREGRPAGGRRVHDCARGNG